MIGQATADDYDGVWEIFHQVIKTGDTYVFSPDTPQSDFSKLWFASNMHTYVYEENKKIVGTYVLKPNQIDLGSHIANASYMVHPNMQGKGIGKILCSHSLDLAKSLGFIGMQFNIVVSSNKGAISLWENFGFKIIGTTPKGFNHKSLGYIDSYIMYKVL